MKNLSSKDKVILYCLAVIGIFFVYYELFVNPMLNKISETQTAIEDKRIQADEIRNMSTENKKMEKAIAELSEKYESYKKLLPIDIRDPEIQKDLHTLAFNNAIQLSSITFGGEVQYKTSDSDKNTGNGKGQLMMIPVSLSFKGDFTKIMDFIKKIEKADRISELQNINLTKADEASVNANVVVNYYFISGDEEDKKNLEYDFTVPVNGRVDLFN